MTRTAVHVTDIAPPRAYYSHAVRGGDAVYVAGQVPVDEGGSVVPGGAEAQARQVMENLSAVLAAAGATLDDVVKTTVYLTSREHRAAVGRVRKEYFASPPPANTLLIVAGLAEPDMMVEIEAIAVVPMRRG